MGMLAHKLCIQFITHLGAWFCVLFRHSMHSLPQLGPARDVISTVTHAGCCVCGKLYMGYYIFGCRTTSSYTLKALSIYIYINVY